MFLMEWRGRQGKETEHNTTRKFQDDMERKNKEVKEKRKVPEGELRQDRRKTGTKKERERESEKNKERNPPLETLYPTPLPPETSNTALPKFLELAFPR